MSNKVIELVKIYYDESFISIMDAEPKKNTLIKLLPNFISAHSLSYEQYLHTNKILIAGPDSCQICE